ncbi:CoA pyrophosphatase [Silicimonas sp. MF1-12-2]|uniref:CoA pyrophosphatase n=1 Tax=Silicimonas sp. MF1-12-2 TaxID=3384793 RepID=UPI0039B5AAC0
MTSDLRFRLDRALAMHGRPSSDFDLNKGVVLPEGRPLRAAGVLVPVIDRGRDAHVLLTKRSSALKHHPGQIAFPGGKVDPDDRDVVATALREAREEIGLIEGQAEVLGALPSHETVTGFTVTPVLALIDPGFRAMPEAGEVEEVFEVPLDHVMDIAQYRIQSRRWRGQVRSYFAVPWGPYYIWGATARMLRALADRMADDAD